MKTLPKSLTKKAELESAVCTILTGGIVVLLVNRMAFAGVDRSQLAEATVIDTCGGRR